MSAADERAAYIAGLRRIADALEHDGLVLPYDGGRTSELSVFTENLAELQAWVRLLEGQRSKQVTESGGYGFQMHGTVGGVRVLLYAPRAEVCTRVVKGTREVTREVADPEALAAVPTVTVTETVEDVEWVCAPVLAPREAEAGVA